MDTLNHKIIMNNPSFENILNLLKEQLPSIIGNNEAYLVSDVFLRFTLYIVSPSNELISQVQTKFNTWIKEVESIEQNDFLHQDLQMGKISITDTLFFVNRHSEKLNWFIEDSEKPSLNAKIIAFYSFKGGLGRTTALVLTAIQLARQGKKIALVDFDLEAPGLASLFLIDYPQYSKVNGVVDFLLDLSVNEFNQENLDLASYYFTINQQDIVGTNNGELVIFPATRTDFERTNGLNYIDKLSKVNLQYNDSHYVADYLFSTIDEKIQPDYILIDTRTGVNDIGGLILHRYADLSFLFFYGNQQNMFGLDSVVEKLKYFNSRFYLINSPTPREEQTRQEEIHYFLENSYQIFSDLFYENSSIPDQYDETADHYPIHIPYSDTATLLNNTRKLKILLEEGGKENPYQKIANYILAEKSDTNVDDEPTNFDENELIKAMSKIIDSSAASENEFKTETDLVKKFYPRKDYRFIFDRSKFLILGEKGAGKTALYAVLTHNDYAKELAKYCETNTQELQSTAWIKGLDDSEEFPSETNFKNLQDLTDTQLRNYWILLLGKEVAKSNSERLPISISDSLPKLKTLAMDNSIGERIEEYLQDINNKLRQEGRYLSVIYDYLDRKLTDENNLRGRLVGALLSLWYEYHNRFSNIKTKIFLREDIYDREIPSGVTDKVKLDNFKQNIDWNQIQLLDMVWKRIIEQDETKSVIQFLQKNDCEIQRIDGLGYVPLLNEDQHTKLLEKLFGKRMGSNNKAFPYNWIEQHISDTHKHIQPRSILNLFGIGAKNQLLDNTQKNTIIRPRNFEDAMADVSKNRVRDLVEEYPQLNAVFEKLRTKNDKFPITEKALSQAIQEIISTSNATMASDEVIDKLVGIGVLYEYKFNKKTTGIRYHIPDLYLFGLGLSRKGPGAHKAMFDKNRKRSRN
ncbi:MAG: ParA family protein [Runella slithyformis]|nr:MAG: ParA family protein [Runella slithyformis]TAE99876.1 MAG: ParA family protein [Runella slithyformis]TAF25293.1 MAG: ParA family protein [Runella slithyformis]TAF47489.1 MAG: ParA family protein [Runella slithyformis]TAF79712.1 MAG: ParA family protein [Runella slithyformis]